MSAPPHSIIIMLMTTLYIVAFSYLHQDILWYIFHSCLQSYQEMGTLASQWPLAWSRECTGEGKNHLQPTNESSSRHVRFADVSVRTYQVIQYPDREVKPFITLDWTYDTERHFSIDQFETIRQPVSKKSKRPRQTSTRATISSLSASKLRKSPQKTKKANKGRPTLQRIKSFASERQASKLKKRREKKAQRRVCISKQ